MNTKYDVYKSFLEACNAKKFIQAEQLLKDLIVNMTNESHTNLSITRTKHDAPFDYIGQIKNGDCIETVAIDFKISNSKLSINRMSSVFVNALFYDIKNVYIFSNNNLTVSAKNQASVFCEKTGINYQLFGKRELDKWFSSQSLHSEFINNSSVHNIIVNMSKQLAKYIALNPKDYMSVEWRDLERIIATVFSEFGYNVDLTPASKDGGKDVIVYYNGESYIIEIKHWNVPNKVNSTLISDFLKIVVRENRKSGIYLSSSGYTSNAFETLSKIEKQKLRYGDKDSVIRLLKMYQRINNGMYVPVNNLEEILNEVTLSFK